MWREIAYNMFIGDNKKLEYTGTKEVKEAKLKRLDELRKKFGMSKLQADALIEHVKQTKSENS